MCVTACISFSVFYVNRLGFRVKNVCTVWLYAMKPDTEDELVMKVINLNLQYIYSEVCI